ncbi:hepatitis A virus cellular receptor 1 homolog isoform X2 [Clupea harengus]|uniref:Hepatitis A virus cellular receptor 1 homolog isoform X2 n=1 Tax=Clupea harengus TaxID=7950 RepID=A0A6P8GXM6_CLUHA|nr:hepatitis A virus cellular receptor 1 homolog isoform X2 [Clupea harengus]
MSLVTTGRPHLSQFREKKEVGNALSVATGTMSGFFLTCYFFLLIFFGVQSITVVGLVGQTVTLSCKYNTNTHHITSTCWGRGKVPWSRCADPLLSTNDGGRVTYRESERYQLHGRVKEGDVSLSIQNVEENDSGIYGCRVELPGWFNDLKINIRLTIIKAPDSLTSVSTPLVLPTASFDEHPAITEDYDEPVVNSVHSKENTLFWPQNIVRMAVVIIMTVATPVFIYGLTTLLKKKSNEGTAP